MVRPLGLLCARSVIRANRCLLQHRMANCHYPKKAWDGTPFVVLAALACFGHNGCTLLAGWVEREAMLDRRGGDSPHLAVPFFFE